jgi:hypothetical protein
MQTPLKLHQLFVGLQVTSRQSSIYENAGSHGVSSKEKDLDIIDATVVLALAKAAEKGSYSRVHVIVPQDFRAIVFERIHLMAKNFTLSVRVLPEAAKQKKSKAIARKLLEALHLPETRVNHIFSISEPERWVAIGYSTVDPLPEWLSNGLL